MARYVIDPAVLVRIALDDLPVSPGHQLVAPNSLRTAALELLLPAVREGRLSDREAGAAHERMTGVRIRLLGDRVSRSTAWRLARERGWPDLRDAEYLAVARLQADALVALEPGLMSRAAGLVPLAPLDALGRDAR